MPTRCPACRPRSATARRRPLLSLPWPPTLFAKSRAQTRRVGSRATEHHSAKTGEVSSAARVGRAQCLGNRRGTVRFRGSGPSGDLEQDAEADAVTARLGPARRRARARPAEDEAHRLRHPSAWLLLWAYSTATSSPVSRSTSVTTLLAP